MKRKFEIQKSKLYAPADYSQILKAGNFAGFDLSYRELSKISVPSGAVCFFDVYSQGNSAKPFMQKFGENNATPFYLGVETSAGERIAFAGLRFPGGEPVSWRLALYEQRDVIKLTADNGHPVSVMSHSGFIGFSDYLVQREYFTSARAAGDEHPLNNVVRFDGNTALLYEVPCSGSIAVFSSGWGDGDYPSYIGFTEDNRPVAVICDFLMIEPPKKETVAGTESFEFDIEIEQLYQNDPNLSPDENNVAKWSFVIDHIDEIDEHTLYRAYARRGYAYHSLRDLKAALGDYYSAMELAEKLEKSGARKMREWTLYDNAGTINKELGNLTEAKRLFEKGKTVGDNFYSGAYVSLIEIYMTEKDYEKAEEAASEMIRVRPSDPVSYMKSAEVYVAAEKYENAIGCYDILIEKFHWDEAIMEKTACLGLLGRYGDALETLETYITENAPNEIYYHNKGFLQYKQNRFTESYQNLLRAYEYNPQFTPALSLLIEMDELFFDYKSVLQWSAQYVSARPESEYGYSVRADAYVKLGEFSLAEADYERILDGISDDPVYFRRLISACVSGGDFKKAQKYLKKVKKLDPALYAHCTALVFAKKGKIAKAENCFVVSDQKNEEALCDAVDFYIRIKQGSRAEKYLSELSSAALASENYAVRKFNYARVFGPPSGAAAAVLDQYLDARLPGMRTTPEAEVIKARMIAVADIYLKKK